MEQVLEIVFHRIKLIAHALGTFGNMIANRQVETVEVESPVHLAESIAALIPTYKT